MFAAAALVALDQGVAQIEKDHAAARALAKELATVDGVSVDLGLVHTNLVRVQLRDSNWQASVVVRTLGELGVGASLSDAGAIRFATHRGFEVRDVPKVKHALANAVSFHVRAATDKPGRVPTEDV